MEACRIGKGGHAQSKRPVKVVLANSMCARTILSKAKNLRLINQFKTVYVSPDRTLEERKEYKELLTELKRKRTEQSQRKHFIRNGIVCSEEKSVVP